MSSPLPDLDALSLDGLKQLVTRLLARMAAMEEENRRLREENARLKDLPKRPKLAPGGMDQASGPDRQAATKAARRSDPARNSVYGRAVEPQPARALVKRSPKRTANWALASAHSRGGILHSFSARFKTRKSSFSAASSVGKWPLALTARRSLELSASMAFVVYNSRRTSPGKA